MLSLISRRWSFNAEIALTHQNCYRRLDVIELRNWVIALGGDPVTFMAGLEDRINRNSELPGQGKTAGKRSTSARSS